MESRAKAQDNFNNANLVFAQKTTFDKAFPEIVDINVQIKEFNNYQPSIYNLSKNNLSEFFNCHNTLCYNGGVQIGSIVRSMVNNHETTHESKHLCQGYEGSPKGRIKYRKCMNMFDVKIEITYNTEIIKPDQ